MQPTNTESKKSQRFKTAPEAADYLRVSERTLSKLEIPRIQIGRSVRYDTSDLDSFAEGAKVAQEA